MKMTQSDPTNPSSDELLANFTDRVLDGHTSSAASDADAELRGLEEMVLRLKRTLPEQAPDAKTLRRLQASFKVRARQEGFRNSPTWQFLRPRQRLVLAFAGMTLVAILIAVPFLMTTNGPVEGSAGTQAQAILVVAGIGCVIG